MEIKVCKFGGTSNADAKNINAVAKIILSDETRRFVVVSAPGKRFKEDEKITDVLCKCCEEIRMFGNCQNSFAKIRERFCQIVSELDLNLDIENYLDKTEKEIIDSKGDRDFAASRGEYLSAIIMAKKLNFEFIDAADIIKFTEEGQFDSEYTNDLCKQVLSKLKKVVIPGFYGRKSNGNIKTFSRGGSDITGSVIARAVGAEVYENWTDVNGFLVTDPRIVKNVETIKMLSYKELRELAYMGANVLHEDAIFPVSVAEIPINIKNTFNPSHEGTMIVPQSKYLKAENIITGIAGTKGFNIFYIEKARMTNELGFARKVLSVFEHYGVSVEHLPTGIDTMSVIVDSELLQNGTKQKLLDGIMRAVTPDNITLSDEVAMIAIVGHGMQQKKGVAARLFSAIANADINIRMIDQGSSEINIIIGVDNIDYENCIKAIYAEFYK